MTDDEIIAALTRRMLAAENEALDYAERNSELRDLLSSAEREVRRLRDTAESMGRPYFRDPAGFIAAAKLALCSDALNQPGGLLNAIKLVRSVTGCGLKEAKDAVEAAGLRPQAPEEAA